MEILDSELQSVNPADFESDCEPPQDKVHDKKLIEKTEMIRVYKQILKTGRLLDKPAKYDKVEIRMKRMEQSEDKEILLDYKSLLDTDLQQFNLGLEKKEWFVDNILTTMKRGEVGLVSIQQLKLDAGVKVIDYEVFYQMQLLDYVTVIDLDMDFQYMKTIHKHGQHNQRARVSDLLDATFHLYTKSGISIFNGKIERLSVSVYENDGNIVKIVKGMKEKEKNITEIKIQTYLEKLQTNIEYYQQIQDYVNEKQEENLYLEIEINKIYEIDDLFSDGLFMKTVIVNGLHQNRPSTNSKLQIDFCIQNKQGNIFFKTKHFETDIQTLCQIQQTKNDEKLKKVKDVKIKRLKKQTKRFIVQQNKKEQDDEKEQEQEKEEKEEEEEEKENLESSSSESDQDQLIDDANKGLIFYADDYKVSRALKICLKTMRKGEVCEMEVLNKDQSKQEILFKRLSYGLDNTLLDKELDGIKSLENVKYIIQMHNFTEGKNAFTMNVDEKIFTGKRKKEMGVQFIQKNDLKKAYKVFQNVNSLFELGLDEQQMKQVAMIKSQCLLNTSLILMKQEKFQDCIQIVEKVLLIEQENVKAIYRKAYCQFKLSEYQKSVETIKGLSSYQDQRQLVELLREVVKMEEEYKKKEKSIYSQMFN